MGTQFTSSQVLFILLAVTVPEAKRAKPENGETEGNSNLLDFRSPIRFGTIPGNGIQVAQCVMSL